MTDGVFPSALRELRGELTQRPVVVIVLAVGLVLGVSGPFDTLQVLALFPRVTYWIAIVALSFALGSLVSTVVRLSLTGVPIGWRMLVSTCGIGLAVTALVCLINLVLFGIWPATARAMAEQLGVVTLIAGVIEVCVYLLRTGTAPGAREPAPLMARLSRDMQGALIALSAEDHYVRVTTTAGGELVLMRLSDAIGEVGDTPGLQVHRSHWVALDQIRDVRRTGDRGLVTLSDGSERPVSRGFMPAVRAAGLLPDKPKAQSVRPKA